MLPGVNSPSGSKSKSLNVHTDVDLLAEGAPDFMTGGSAVVDASAHPSAVTEEHAATAVGDDTSTCYGSACMDAEGKGEIQAPRASHGRNGLVQTWTWSHRETILEQQADEDPVARAPSSQTKRAKRPVTVVAAVHAPSGKRKSSPPPPAARRPISMILEESYEMDGVLVTTVHEPAIASRADLVAAGFPGSAESAKRKSNPAPPAARRPISMILEESYEVDGVLVTTVHEPAITTRADLAAAGFLDYTESEGKRRGRTSKPARGSKEDKSAKPKARIKIGPEYQASIPVRGSYGPHEASLGGEVLWDPDRVFRGRTDEQIRGIRSLLLQKRDFSDQMLMIECLAATDYNANDAQTEFDRKVASRRSLELTYQEREVFESMIQKKDFTAISKALGRSKGELLTYYYRWKGRDKEAYEAAMSGLKKRQSKCCVCDDGGCLIVCELCRNAYHLYCLDPPLQSFPNVDWYCLRCNRASPPLERRPSLKGARLSTSPKRKAKLVTESSRKRLRSTQKEFDHPKPKETATFSSPNLGAEENNSCASAVESLLTSNSSSNCAAPADDDTGSDGTASEAGRDDESDNNNSPSSSVASLSVVPAKPKKRVASSYSDESYHESEDEGSAVGEDDDDNYLMLGASEKEDRALAKGRRSTKTAGKCQSRAADERADQFSTDPNGQYEAFVPFKSDGTLGLHVALARSTGQKVFVGYDPDTWDAKASGPDGKCRLFSGDRDVILKIDDEDTNNMPWGIFLGRLARRTEGQPFKKLLMLHVKRRPGSPSLPSLEAGNEKSHRRPTGCGKPQPTEKTIALPELSQTKASTRLREAVPALSGDTLSRSLSERQEMMQLDAEPEASLRTVPPHVPPFMAEAASHVAMFNDTRMEPLLHESMINDAPAFLAFLRSLNLLTVQSFLLADSDALARDWATRTGLDRSTSRDYVGAMKFRFVARPSVAR